MVLAGVAMSAIYAAYLTQQRAYKTTQDVTAVQQNLRAGMYFLEKDLRMAGYDPLDSGAFGFTNVLEDSFKFTWDQDEDGVLSGSSEYITYKFETPETTLERDSGDGSFNDIAAEVTDVTFTYLTASGVTTTTPGLVRAVRVSMTAERGDHARTLQSLIWCRNAGL
jgi:type IV pilus assembly protein PilW